MKKWLPYLLAAAVGIGLAFLMFLPDTSTKKPEPRAPSTETLTATRSTGPRPSGIDALAPVDPTRASATPPPPPGTLRPMNQAEIEQQARESRPFNAHTNRVQSYWLLASKEVTATNADLAKEARDMMTYVREQSRLNDDEVSVDEVIRKELALEKKLRDEAAGNTRLTAILDYINSSANAVIQNGDPSTIPIPTALSQPN